MNKWNSNTVGTILEHHCVENQGITTEDIVALTNITKTLMYCILSKNFQLCHVCSIWTLFTLLKKKCKQDFFNAGRGNRCFKMIRLSKDFNRWWKVMKLGGFVLIPLPSLQQVHGNTLIIRLPKHWTKELCCKVHNDFFRS